MGSAFIASHFTTPTTVVVIILSRHSLINQIVFGIWRSILIRAIWASELKADRLNDLADIIAPAGAAM